jgi:hypothetical protein
MTDHQVNEDPSPKQSNEPIVAIVVAIVGPAVTVLGILYSIASGAFQPRPLIVTLVAASFIVVAGWQYVKLRHPTWTVIAPAVMAVVLPVSSATLAAPRHPTTSVSPHAASVIAMRRLPTKTAGPQYVVDVKVIDRPPSDRSLWLVSVLYAEPGKLKDTLYFAKAPVPSATGTYQIPIRYCKPLATDLQRALEIVAADAAASKILAKNRYEEDNCIKNSDMTDPAGAVPVSDAFKFFASP